MVYFDQIPVPDNDETFDYNVHNRHVLYNGTQLLQGRAQSNHTFLKAIVIRTGSSFCTEFIHTHHSGWKIRLHDEQRRADPSDSVPETDTLPFLHGLVESGRAVLCHRARGDGVLDLRVDSKRSNFLHHSISFIDLNWFHYRAARRTSYLTRLTSSLSWCLHCYQLLWRRYQPLLREGCWTETSTVSVRNTSVCAVELILFALTRYYKILNTLLKLMIVK